MSRVVTVEKRTAGVVTRRRFPQVRHGTGSVAGLERLAFAGLQQELCDRCPCVVAPIEAVDVEALCRRSRKMRLKLGELGRGAVGADENRGRDA